MPFLLTIDERRVIRFSVVNDRDTAVEFPMQHRPGITADRGSLSGCGIGPSQGSWLNLNPKPLERAGAYRVTICIAIARPGRDVSGFGIVVPNERLLVVIGALVGPAGVGD